jgi:hypothetical protein
LAVLAGWIGIASVVIYFKSQARLTRVYELPGETVPIPTDSASLERGQQIFWFRRTASCLGSAGFARAGVGESVIARTLCLAHILRQSFGEVF